MVIVYQKCLVYNLHELAKALSVSYFVICSYIRLFYNANICNKNINIYVISANIVHENTS